MSNDLRGEHEVEIGGRVRRFKFTMSAIREAQKALKVNGMIAIWDALLRFDVEAITFLLWLGLRKDDPSLQLKEVCEWDVTVCDITRIVKDGLKASMGGEEKEKETDPKAETE